jgi:hypothetical protein
LVVLSVVMAVAWAVGMIAIFSIDPAIAKHTTAG